jgi:ATP-binding cassette subfamily B protein
MKQDKEKTVGTNPARLPSRMWRRLSARRRRQAVLLFGLMLVGACAEVISLGAVVPFIAALSAPEHLLGYPEIADLTKTLGVVSREQLTIAMTVIFALAALLAGGVRLLLLWSSSRLAFSTGEDFGLEIYRRTMYKPYPMHVTDNSSHVITTITKKVGSTTLVLQSLMTLASSGVLLTAIILTLLMVNPWVAFVAAASFGLSYAAVMVVFRTRLVSNSRRVVQEHTNVVRTIQEGLGGIRDILLDGSQEVFCEAFRQADHRLRRAHASSAIIAGAPRFIMEALGMVLIAALAYGLSRHGEGLGTALPVLGALALGAQRVLPILQQSYSAWAIINGSQTSVNYILSMLEQPLPPEATRPVPAPLRWQRDIRVEAIRFQYASSGPWVIDGLDLTIAKGARVGFIGSTGSGKSTVLDLLMGLLEPTAGRILIDGEPLTAERMRAWQRTIAHVPQNIYLADASIGENIAFGVPVALIDRERVRHAASLAQLDEYIQSHPDGYRANVGERGIVLSGGQRQRIGIARALYKQASVLVLDEATNALDKSTEHGVMQAIAGLGRDITVLAVTHRVTTFEGFDYIVELVNGRAVVHRSYERMVEALRDREYV